MYTYNIIRSIQCHDIVQINYSFASMYDCVYCACMCDLLQCILLYILAVVGTCI